MTMDLRTMELTAAPGKRPLTIEEGKSHLNVTLDDDDDLIESYIDAAVSVVEAFTRRKLVDQTWKMHIRDGFDTDSRGRIEIPFAPLSSLSSIKYLDSAGASQTWASTNYDVVTPVGPHAMPAYVELAFGKSFPSVRGAWNSVTIEYIAGYGDNSDDVPAAIRSAIRLLLATYYENRESVIVGTIAQELPKVVEVLLMPFRSEL